MKRTTEQKSQERREALNRAVSNTTMANYPAIIEGFMERGLPAEAILPRENVFTYNAWLALGRQVRRGERGVRVVTWIVKGGKVDAETGEQTGGVRFPKTTTVFHVSQTDEAKERTPAMASEQVEAAA